MTRGKTLLLGIAIGAVSIVLYTRLRQVIEEEDPQALVDRLSHQLAELEARGRTKAEEA